MPLQIFNTTRKELPEELLERTVIDVLDSEGFGIESIVAVYCGKKNDQKDQQGVSAA